MLLLLLLSVNCFAGGKLVVEGDHKFNSSRYHSNVGAIGIATYEKLSGPMYFTTYAGGGMQDELTVGNRQDCWAAISTAVGFKFGKFVVEPGATMKFLTDSSRFNNDVHVKASYQLW